MEKRGIFLLILIIGLMALAILNINFVKQITGKVITGFATSQLDVNITLTGTPGLIIRNPLNQTYLTNQSLLIQYVSGGEYVWYNIDHGINTTITGDTYFNTTQGDHTIYLFANNSYGETTKNTSFFVNSSKFKIHFEEYQGSKKGDSTNFNHYHYQYIQMNS